MASVADWFRGHGLAKFAEKISPDCSVSLEEFLKYDDKQLKGFAKASLGLDTLESKRMVKEVRKLIVGSSEGTAPVSAAAPSASAVPVGGMTAAAASGEALMAPQERHPLIEKLLFDEWKKVSDLETQLSASLSSIEDVMLTEQKRLEMELKKWCDLCAAKEALLAAWVSETAKVKDRAMREQFEKLRSWQIEVEAKSKGGSADTLKLTRAVTNVDVMDSSPRMEVTMSSLCDQTELVQPSMDECDTPVPPNPVSVDSVAIKDGSCIIPLIFECDLTSDEPDLAPDIKVQRKPAFIEAMLEDKKGNLVSLVKLSLKKLMAQSKGNRKEWQKWKMKSEEKSSKKKSSKKRRKKHESDSDESSSEDDSSEESSSEESSSESSSSSEDPKKRAKRKKKEKKRAKEIERFRNMPEIMETLSMFQEEMQYEMEEEFEFGGGGSSGVIAGYRQELATLLLQYGMDADTLEAALDEFLPSSKVDGSSSKKKKSKKSKSKKKKKGTLKSSKSGESAAAAPSAMDEMDGLSVREKGSYLSSVRSAFSSASAAISGAVTLSVPEGESGTEGSSDAGSVSGMDEDAKSTGSTASVKSAMSSRSSKEDTADEVTGLGFAYYLKISGLKPNSTSRIRILCSNDFGVAEMDEALTLETDNFMQLKWDSKLAKKHSLLKLYVKFKKDDSVAHIIGFEPNYGTTLRGTLAFACSDLKHFCWEIKIREVGQGMNLGMMCGTETSSKKKRSKKRKVSKKEQLRQQAMMSQWGAGYGSIDSPVFTNFASSMLISCEIYQSMGGIMYCYTATSDVQLTVPNGTIMNGDVLGFDVNMKKASADVYLNYNPIGSIPGLPIFGEMKVTPMVQCYNNGGGTMPVIEIHSVNDPSDLKRKKKKK